MSPEIRASAWPLERTTASSRKTRPPPWARASRVGLPFESASFFLARARTYSAASASRLVTATASSSGRLSARPARSHLLPQPLGHCSSAPKVFGARMTWVFTSPYACVFTRRKHGCSLRKRARGARLASRCSVFHPAAGRAESRGTTATRASGRGRGRRGGRRVERLLV